MKHQSILLSALLLMTACTGGKQGATTPQNQDLGGDVSPAEGVFAIDNNFYMLREDKLPQQVDLKQDITKLDYQSLRLLKSYVYAIHGHWFMEADLNSFFSSHTSWYVGLCYKTAYLAWEYEKETPEVTKAIAYIKALEQDYPHAYELIELNDEEKAFVSNIEQRMQRLMRGKEVNTPDGDATILNANLMINWHQIYEPGAGLTDRLIHSNVAFESTNYEQLFNVYEDNDYHIIPSFITTDVMLQAYHMYFSFVMKSLERHEFTSRLSTIFDQLYLANQHEMQSSTDDEELIACQFRTAAYTLVAKRLLGEEPMVPEQLAALCDTEYNNVMKASDNDSPLFRTTFKFPYSLFRPRGHYTRTPDAERYFRTMMWMQKGCFYREQRDQLQWAIYLAQLINQMPESAQKELHSLNDAIAFLMGQPDNISLIEVASHLRQMKVKTVAEALSDNTIQAIDDWIKEDFKTRNLISSAFRGPQDQLNLMPQRYTVDADILGSLYDSIPNAERAFPKGLDVFSVFGSEAATALLDTCYHTKEIWNLYQPKFDRVSQRLSGFDQWDETFYNKWIEDLIVLQKQDKSQPGFMQTHTWQLKNVNTALASWALLKHDAILYAEQPMAAECGGGPELPSPRLVGYVEPNVPFWQKLRETLSLNRKVLEQTGYMTRKISEITERLEEFADFCLRIAKAEIDRKPISDEDYETIRVFGSSMEYFTLSVLDPDLEFWGWWDVSGADRKVAQVADVFTRVIQGCERSGILYEAVGNPLAMYVVVEIDGQCYLTRGATYSYYEFVRSHNDPRLTDDDWQKMIEEGKAPAMTEWFAPLILSKPTVTDERYVYSTGC